MAFVRYCAGSFLLFAKGLEFPQTKLHNHKGGQRTRQSKKLQ